MLDRDGKVKIEKARIEDAPQMHRLINSFAEQGDMLPRPLSELYENLRDFFVAREGGEVVACVALHVLWADLAEIKSLAVDQGKQDEGLGRLLVEACLEEARGLGIPTLFCLTYSPEFFERFGFRRIDVMELPRKVWGECQRCSKFPNCDETALILPLDGGT
jgi:amino-acid N-acetyltransferase